MVDKMILVSEAVHQQFKIEAVRQGKPMRDLANEILIQYLARQIKARQSADDQCPLEGRDESPGPGAM